MVNNNRTSAAKSVFLRMLDNIHEGQWPVGAAIPSERNLIDEFGVSRVAIREAVSMLRGLGVVDVSHGKRTRVRHVDLQVLDQLWPVMLACGGQKTFSQIFEVRLALESRTAYLAAITRTAEQLRSLEILVDRFREQSKTGSSDAIGTDMEFHMQIAHATGNPLFPTLLDALARLVEFGQRESCKDDAKRRQRAVFAHEAIAEAIADRDPERARAEMESHLMYSASRVIAAIRPSSSNN